MKKGYTLIELLSVIVILAIIVAIAYPKVLDVVGASKISAYNSAKNNIIESAKLKYLADVNSSKITEYTVDELMDSGYLKKGSKNPLTNKDYEDTKVVITNNNGKISYEYIEGNTLFDCIKDLNDKEGLYKENDTYLYKGINSYNYASFNGEIYRILKIDSYRNIYLLKTQDKKMINKNDIENYVDSYYNDNYSQLIKEKIDSIGILDYQDYQNSYIENETYIENDNNIWVKNGSEYKVLFYLNNELINDIEADTRLVIKIKNTNIVERGNGTQINPYIIK